MDELEIYAQEKEEEKESIRHIAEAALKHGFLNQRLLKHFMDKAFHLGHSAGHCRGEKYKNDLKEGSK